MTQYTYQGGWNPATENALTSIQLADGSLVNFTYDAAGQLTGYSQAGGADPVTYAYNVGEVSITDAAGAYRASTISMTTAICVKLIDPLGNISFATYDSQRQPDEPHRPDRPDRHVQLRRQRQSYQLDERARPDNVLHLRGRRQLTDQLDQCPGRRHQLRSTMPTANVTLDPRSGQLRSNR